MARCCVWLNKFNSSVKRRFAMSIFNDTFAVAKKLQVLNQVIQVGLVGFASAAVVLEMFVVVG